LTRKQEEEAAIGALLTASTLEGAAALCETSVATLRRWMREPTFREAYRQARGTVLERLIARLLGATDQALLCLERNVNCKKPSVEVRAALGILSNAIKGSETLDLEERLRNLEALVATRKDRT
jgi:hypothetical protein